MQPKELQESWKEQGEVVFAAVAQWRQTHPKATLVEIEEAIDQQMNPLRAQMIQEAASNEAVEGLVCEQCGKGLQARGRKRRSWQMQGGQSVEIERSYVTCPQCGGGFFPLDEELDVPDGHLLPCAQEVLVCLGSELPFARAARHLEKMLVVVHGATARRSTLAVGKRCLQVQAQQAEPLACCPEEPTAARLSMNSDGALVLLRGGIWAEVKLVAIGTVECRKDKKSQEEQAVTRRLSYFARLADAGTFATLASVEIRRQGIERAKEVYAIQDGTEWLQGFVQSHRCDALRILDFAHVAGYLSEIAQLICASEGHLLPKWLDGVCHRLLRHVSRLAVRYPQVQEKVTYLQKHREQMDYPTYQRNGWPIGSGTVESGHKLVMQARLKGPGMHWKPEHLNPMLALRMAICNDRWDENWTDQRRLLRHNVCCVVVHAPSSASKSCKMHAARLCRLSLAHQGQYVKKLDAPRLRNDGDDNPFSLACFSKLGAQKSETHPCICHYSSWSDQSSHSILNICQSIFLSC